MYNFAICDGNKDFCKTLEVLIMVNYPLNIKSLDIYANGKEMIDNISNNNLSYDFFFLDISVTNDGITTGNALRTIDRLNNAYIIYISEYDVKASEIINIHPYAYLKKPLDTNLLYQTIDSAILDINFVFSFNKINYSIPYSSIMYIENYNKRSVLHCNEQEYDCSYSLSSIYSALHKIKSEFVRIHNSYMVNIDYVYKFNGSILTLKNMDILPVSRKYKNNFINKFNNNLLIDHSKSIFQ